jgi:CubicO group peptidase (beta-lactamase class C family)
MRDWAGELAALTAGFAGVVSVSTGHDIEFEQAYGLADRAHATPTTPATRFGIASATKGFTALTVVSLILDGALRLDTTARSALGADLPLIGDVVTVEQLLAHRSGVGDYVDEDLPEPLPLKVPVQDLDTTESYLPALAGFPAKFPPGARFSYCNSGYVLLALIAERTSGTAFPDLVADRVLRPAGMTDTSFPRSDEPSTLAATGYLDDGRTNVFRLPVRGSGDGGALSTVADLRRFWLALFSGAVVPVDWARRMTTAVTRDTGHPFGYGMGFWLDEAGRVLLDGCDHGVSCRSVHDPASGRSTSVLSNTTSGAFPVARRLHELALGG